MAFEEVCVDKRFLMADYRVRIFLSVDLSGSTAFKNSDKGNEITGPSPRWVTVFQNFYKEFPSRYRYNYKEQSSGAIGSDECPDVWKAIGDEIVFCGRVTNKTSVATALKTFIKTLTDYRDNLNSEALELNVKGAGWLAAFPTPNRTVEVRPRSEHGEFLSASEALELEADQAPFNFDFLGKGIDTGFRIASKSHPERFTLCVQLARLLCSMRKDIAIAHEIHVDHPTELKGVNGGIPYPSLYINTLDHLKIARVRELERRILPKNIVPPKDEVANYLAEYCSVAATDEIKLPDSASDPPPSAPESYEAIKPHIAKHLRNERDRGADAIDTLPQTSEINEESRPLEAEEEMMPLRDETDKMQI